MHTTHSLFRTFMLTIHTSLVHAQVYPLFCFGAVYGMRTLEGIRKSPLSARSRRYLAAICTSFLFYRKIVHSTTSASFMTSDAWRRCLNVSTDATYADDNTLDVNGDITKMLLSVDHVFILSFGGCRTTLSTQLKGKATCILGREVDRCAPKQLISGTSRHAMRVTFSHALILQLAIEAQYRHVAVMEDDIQLISRSNSADLYSNFVKLIRSPAWSIIRFSFRPYFLEESAVKPCPFKCKCDTSQYGPQLCRLRLSGCDIRSSDFYILNSRSITRLQYQLLDRRRSNTRRVVDVHPMQSFSNQWILLPQVSYQQTLAVPAEFQIGEGALFIKKCVHPRPLPDILTAQVTHP